MPNYEFYALLSWIVSVLSLGFVISVLLYFLLVRKVQRADSSDTAQISRFICTLSLTIALLEYVFLLASTLLHRISAEPVVWPVVFFGTSASLFFLLPFAYFMLESVGIRFFFAAPAFILDRGRRRRHYFHREDLFSRLAEALLSSLLFAMLLLGVAVLLGLLVLMRRQPIPLVDSPPPVSPSPLSVFNSPPPPPPPPPVFNSPPPPPPPVFNSPPPPPSPLSNSPSQPPPPPLTTNLLLPPSPPCRPLADAHFEQLLHASARPVCTLDESPSSWYQFVFRRSYADLLDKIWEHLTLAYDVVMHTSTFLFALLSPAGLNRITSFLRHTVRLPSALQRAFLVVHVATTVYTLCCVTAQLTSHSLPVSVDLTAADALLWQLLVCSLRLFDTLALAHYWLCSFVSLYQFQCTRNALKDDSIPSMIYTTALVVLLSTSLPAAGSTLGLQSKNFREIGYVSPLTRGAAEASAVHTAAAAGFLAGFVYFSDDVRAFIGVP